MTPQTIFKNEIITFDVNFFNPMADKTETKITTNGIKRSDYDIGYEIYTENMEEKVDSNGKVNDTSDRSAGTESTLTFNNSSPEKVIDSFSKSIGKTLDSSVAEVVYEDGKEKQEFCIKNTYNDEEGNSNTGYYKTLQTYNLKYGNKKYVLKYYTYYYNGWTSKTSKETSSSEDIIKQRSPAHELQSTVASWYIAFRNIALVALLSVLVYIGIRITLSSVANDKAKYKQMLIDWFVALCLVFLMHYIMSFAVTINEKIINTISAITISSYGGEEGVCGSNTKTVETESKATVNDYTDEKSDNIKDNGIEMFMIEGKDADNAWKILVGDEDTEYAGNESIYRDRFSGTEDGKRTLFWPANDFMTQARLKGQEVEVKTEIDDNGVEKAKGDGTEEVNPNQTKTVKAGYNIIYVVLVIYTVMFCFVYLKRVVYLAFLTIIAPLVAITYPIDKINDGKAQAFDMWFKEYIFNLLIQPMHLVLYTVLVGSAMRFASNNIFYVVIALGFLMPAEKLLRRFFGFEKAHTPGMFGGPAGTAVMMSGLSSIMRPRTHKSGLGPGEKESVTTKGADETKTPVMNKKLENPDMIFGNEDKGDKSLINMPNQLSGNGGSQEENELKYHSDLTRAQIQSLKAEGIKPGSDRYNKVLRGIGIDPEENKNEKGRKDNSSSNQINNNSKPNETGIPKVNTTAIPKTNQTPKKKKLIRIRRGIQAGLRATGRGINKYYGKTNTQMAAMIAKKGLGLGAKIGVTALGTSAAGFASIAGGDPQKAIQNMIIGGTSGYAVGKGIANRVENASMQNTANAVKEGYYGDDYDKKKQQKFEKKFANDEENLRKIQNKLRMEREDAKVVAKRISRYTREDGINNVDQALAIYQMQQGKNGLKEDVAINVAKYNETALGGANTKYMKPKDRSEYMENYKKLLMNGKRKLNEEQANEITSRVFSAMDRYNELK